jgi:hypothetical protein
MEISTPVGLDDVTTSRPMSSPATPQHRLQPAMIRSLLLAAALAGSPPRSQAADLDDDVTTMK